MGGVTSREISSHQTGRSVRLDTLIRLRWLAVIGQATAVLVVYWGLDFELPVWACLSMIALAAWLNIAMRARFPLRQRLEPDRAVWLLAFDTAELAVLLFFTGGLQNPFALLFLGPVLISAPAAPGAVTAHARRLCRRLRHRAGVRARSAALGYRAAARIAPGLRDGGVALHFARDRLHRPACLADHRGIASARGCVGGNRIGTG